MSVERIEKEYLVTPEAVRREMARIFKTPAFRESKRSQEFLRFVVEATLEGRRDELKERMVGVGAFGREPTYDTNDDPIVRVKANDVRKRLARCNQGDDPEQELRIDLPPGSYATEFTPLTSHRPSLLLSEPEILSKPDPVPLPVPPPGSRSRWIRLAPALAVLPVLLLGGYFLTRETPGGEADKFWKPVFASNQPVLICMGQPIVYHLSKRLHMEFKATLPPNREPGPYSIQLQPDRIVGADVIPVSDQYVGVGDAMAAVQLASMFREGGLRSTVRIGNEVSYPELRNVTAVLIGAFTNRWTLQMLNELRFVFEMDGEHKLVRDRSRADTSWSIPNMPSTGKVPVDYAIVSRIFDSKTGNTVVSAAGITQYGSQAAGEFLSNPTRLSAALRKLGNEWSARNIQFVIRTEIIGSSPMPAAVVAAHSW